MIANTTATVEHQTEKNLFTPEKITPERGFFPDHIAKYNQHTVHFRFGFCWLLVRVACGRAIFSLACVHISLGLVAYWVQQLSTPGTQIKKRSSIFIFGVDCDTIPCHQLKLEKILNQNMNYQKRFRCKDNELVNWLLWGNTCFDSVWL